MKTKRSKDVVARSREIHARIAYNMKNVIPRPFTHEVLVKWQGKITKRIPAQSKAQADILASEALFCAPHDTTVSTRKLK